MCINPHTSSCKVSVTVGIYKTF